MFFWVLGTPHLQKGSRADPSRVQWGSDHTPHFPLTSLGRGNLSAYPGQALHDHHTAPQGAPAPQPTTFGPTPHHLRPDPKRSTNSSS